MIPATKPYDHLSTFQHYLNDADGLCCKLQTPVPKKNGGFEGAVDWKQFEESGWVLHKKDLKLEEIIGRGEFGGMQANLFHTLLHTKPSMLISEICLELT